MGTEDITSPGGGVGEMTSLLHPPSTDSRDTINRNGLDDDADRRGTIVRRASVTSARAQAIRKKIQVEWTDSLRNCQEGEVYAAAFLIRDVVLGSGVHGTEIVRAAGAFDYNPYSQKNHPAMNRISRACRWVLARWAFFSVGQMASWTLALLSFVEPPVWCRDWAAAGDGNGDGVVPTGCTGAMLATGPPAFGNGAGDGGPGECQHDVDYYPNSGATVLNVKQSLVVEWVCIVVIASYILLQMGSMGLSPSRYFFLFKKSPGLDRKSNVGPRIMRMLLVFSVLVTFLDLTLSEWLGTKRLVILAQSSLFIFCINPPPRPFPAPVRLADAQLHFPLRRTLRGRTEKL